MSTDVELRRLLDTALDAARAAVEVHRRHLGRVRVDDWRAKGLADFVTHVDREAEERMIERIRARYPHHAFLAEEAATALPPAAVVEAAPASAGRATEQGRGRERPGEQVKCGPEAGHRNDAMAPKDRAGQVGGQRGPIGRHPGQVGGQPGQPSRQAGQVESQHRQIESQLRQLENQPGQLGSRPGHVGDQPGGADRTAGAASPSGDEWLWVIDPLDGTTNYLHGYPAYAVSVAVLHRGEPLAGAVISGATGEEWSAVHGGGAFRNGRRIHVSGIDRLDYALIGTGFPFRAPDLLPAYLEQFDAVLRRTAGVRRAGSAAIDLCHVATGMFDAFWELVLAPWDVAAGMLIIRESGGRATTLDGEPDVLRGGAILAGNPAIYEALGEVLGPLS